MAKSNSDWLGRENTVEQCPGSLQNKIEKEISRFENHDIKAFIEQVCQGVGTLDSSFIHVLAAVYIARKLCDALFKSPYDRDLSAACCLLLGMMPVDLLLPALDQIGSCLDGPLTHLKRLVITVQQDEISSHNITTLGPGEIAVIARRLITPQGIASA